MPHHLVDRGRRRARRRRHRSRWTRVEKAVLAVGILLVVVAVVLEVEQFILS